MSKFEEITILEMLRVNQGYIFVKCNTSYVLQDLGVIVLPFAVPSKDFV